MKKKFALGILLVLASSASMADAPAGSCESNFTSKGSFFAGKQYQTWQQYDTVSKADAYQKIYSALVKEGYKIQQSDREGGVISAAQEVSFGNGKASPLNVVVEQVGNGSKATVTFSMSGGVSAKATTVQQSLCSYLHAAEAK